MNKPDLVMEDLGVTERKFQVFFESNNTEIPEQFNEMLNDLYIVLSLNEQANLKISGYADPSGNPLNNMRLSLERAQTVSRYFTERGIAQSRIQVEGHNPASNSNRAQEALEKHLGSRKVELLLRD
jgi:outer membrane protein OmpA-like peptidoglycan-associated protein